MNNYLILAILVSTLITFLLRLFPFLWMRLSSHQSQRLYHLINCLPPSVMAILIVYCLKDVPSSMISLGVPSLIAIICVVAIHLYKSNTMLSILVGTIVYMLLLRIM